MSNSNKGFVEENQVENGTYTKTCEDFDECATGDVQCPEGAKCFDIVGGYKCICIDDYMEVGFGCVERAIFQPIIAELFFIGAANPQCSPNCVTVDQASFRQRSVLPK